MNIRCSKRCANPVRPVRSRAEPTWYHMFTVTSGTLWSSCRITVRPFGSLNCVYATSSFVWASAGVVVSAKTSKNAARFIGAILTRRATRRHKGHVAFVSFVLFVLK